MNTECFIKSFLLIIVIFLIISCWTNKETFAEIDFTSSSLIEKIKGKKPFELELNDTYFFISFDQLKDEYQKIVIDKLKNNSEFMIRETIQDVEKGIFFKTPVFISFKKDVSANNKLDFILVSDSGAYALNPYINESLRSKLQDKYLYLNQDLGLLYYSKIGPDKDSIHINNDGFVKLYGLNNNWNNTNLKSINNILNKDLKFKISLK